MARQRGAWPTRALCRLLGVSHSGFHEWLGRATGKRSQENVRLTRLVRESFESSDRTYGSARLCHDLRAAGEICGVNRVARLMQQALLTQHGTTCSMSRRGDCWDNTAMDSFFSTLKTGRVSRSIYRTRDAARADVFDYIERFDNPFDNLHRRHSTLNFLGPVQFEQCIAG
ncbi:Integrase core domain-containing protein [Paraburkholderia lycopersici]|uniref:Integrase core domain-containing protein n=1 Tax=Paraburkholderia lycopersici TaxID=416944 RepID=A0A1G7BG47_9BURK|nr:Integrase core domain-containing protein [Paraburkholderia lycopersici]